MLSVWNVDFWSLFSFALGSNTQIAVHLNLEGSCGLFHATVDQNPLYKLKFDELVDLTTSGIASRFSGCKPNNLWSSLEELWSLWVRRATSWGHCRLDHEGSGDACEEPGKVCLVMASSTTGSFRRCLGSSAPEALGNS